jgi:hypothetical protein
VTKNWGMLVAEVAADTRSWNAKEKEMGCLVDEGVATGSSIS